MRSVNPYMRSNRCPCCTTSRAHTQLKLTLTTQTNSSRSIITIPSFFPLSFPHLFILGSDLVQHLQMHIVLMEYGVIFTRSPFQAYYDPCNRIIYSSLTEAVSDRLGNRMSTVNANVATATSLNISRAHTERRY